LTHRALAEQVAAVAAEMLAQRERIATLEARMDRVEALLSDAIGGEALAASRMQTAVAVAATLRRHGEDEMAEAAIMLAVPHSGWIQAVAHCAALRRDLAVVGG